MELSTAERTRSLRVKVLGILGAVAFASGCGAPSDTEVTCQPRQVFAQAMWPPGGAAVRELPDRASRQVGSLRANQPVNVDYWFHSGKAVYPDNQPPFDSDVWLRVAEQGKPDEWVNFAAVRAGQIAVENFDPTGLKKDVGVPVDLPAECEIKDVAPGELPSVPVVK